MKPIFKISLGLLVGAGFGFAYYYFIGCRTGACPISSNPFISTVYGGVLGVLLTLGSKRPKTTEQKEN